MADAAPAELRGSAFGVFNLVVGVALLAASAVAGALWDLYGPRVTFLPGAGISSAALLGYAVLSLARRPRRGCGDPFHAAIVEARLGFSIH